MIFEDENEHDVISILFSKFHVQRSEFNAFQYGLATENLSH